MIRRPPSSTLFPYTPLSRSVLLPADDGGFRLRFRPTSEPKTGRNRMHFDLTSGPLGEQQRDRKSTRLNSSPANNSYDVFSLQNKKCRILLADNTAWTSE